jgi:ferredoxin
VQEHSLHAHCEACIQVCSTNLAKFNVGNVQVVKILGVVGGHSNNNDLIKRVLGI